MRHRPRAGLRPPPPRWPRCARPAPSPPRPRNAGILYRMPRTGGAITPMLKPEDTVGPLVVGKIMAQAWREDNIVAVAQSGDAGPFTFYFHNGKEWGYSNL